MNKHRVRIRMCMYVNVDNACGIKWIKNDDFRQKLIMLTVCLDLMKVFKNGNHAFVLLLHVAFGKFYLSKILH